MAFTPQQMKKLQPFLWHYPAYSPWRALKQGLLLVIMVSGMVSLLPRLPRAQAIDRQEAVQIIHEMVRASHFGRLLQGDTHPTRVNVAGVVPMPVRDQGDLE